MSAILLTGASSFSGLWIAEALAARGHAVTAPLRRSREAYSGLRRQRVERLEQLAETVFETPFASERFNGLIAERRFDLLAHHAADIENYRSADYDVGLDVARNTHGAQAAFRALAHSGGKAVIVTGTTFERGEGARPADDLALSPYGLAKTLTTEALRHFARWEGLAFGKVIVAAPFGPFEEGRFAWSLIQRWMKREVGVVRTPRYVRDNIPAPLLAEAYADLVEELTGQATVERVSRPQGFAGTQESFARMLAAQMGPRLGLPCEIGVLEQPVLQEPEVLINDEPRIPRSWDAAAFWDAYAAYYQRIAAEGWLDAPA